MPYLILHHSRMPPLCTNTHCLMFKSIKLWLEWEWERVERDKQERGADGSGPHSNTQCAKSNELGGRGRTGVSHVAHVG